MTKLVINVEKGDLDFVQFRQETSVFIINFTLVLQPVVAVKKGRREKAVSGGQTDSKVVLI